MWGHQNSPRQNVCQLSRILLTIWFSVWQCCLKTCFTRYISLFISTTHRTVCHDSCKLRAFRSEEYIRSPQRFFYWRRSNTILAANTIIGNVPCSAVCTCGISRRFFDYVKLKTFTIWTSSRTNRSRGSNCTSTITISRIVLTIGSRFHHQIQLRFFDNQYPFSTTLKILHFACSHTFY